MEIKEFIKNKRKIILFVGAILFVVLIVVGFYFCWKQQLGDGYYLKANKVYFNGVFTTEEVDSFEVTERGFAKNKNLLFYNGDGFSTDADFFKIINSDYVVSLKSIYHLSDKRGLNRVSRVDGKSFKFVKNNYAKDNQRYYYINGYEKSDLPCIYLDFIDDNDEYDVKCGDFYYKQGEFVRLTDERQNYLDEQRIKANEQYALKNYNAELIKKLFGEGHESNYRYLNDMHVECPDKTDDAIEVKLVQEINEKTFSAYYSCQKSNKKCDEVESEGLKIKEELAKNKYNLVNGCLYNDKERVFEYNLLIKKHLGYFSEKDKVFSKEKVSGKYLWDSVEEWFRFVKDDKIFIYLKGGAGCGGCIFNGPYLEIDLGTEEIIGRDASLPYLPNLFLSPDRQRAIMVSYENGENWHINQGLYIYDFIVNKRGKLIYEVSEGKTILADGDGTYPVRDAVKWIDDNTVQVQQYKRSEKDWVEAEYAEEMRDGVSYSVGYKNPDKPIVIKLNEID